MVVRSVRLPQAIRSLPPVWLAVEAVLLVLSLAGTLVLGGLSASLIALLGTSLIILGAWLLTSPGDRGLVVKAITAALGIRLIAMLALHVTLLDRGAGGAMFEDDFGYPTWAHLFARSWRGEAVDVPTDVSVISNYVYLAAAVSWAFGFSVVALKVLNVLMAVGSALFAYRTAYNLFGRSAGLVTLGLMLFFPSLSLWSSLVLKDTFVVMFTMIVVWAMTEYLRTSRAVWLFVGILAVLPLHNTRSYMYTILVVLWPVATLVSYVARRKPSLGYAALSCVAAAALATGGQQFLMPETIANLEGTRSDMAQGAASAFLEERRTLTLRPGEAFVVAGSNEPASTAEVHRVAPGTLILVRPTMDTRPAPAGAAIVRPGDVVVAVTPEPVASREPVPSTTPVPFAELPTMALPPSGSVIETPETNDLRSRLLRNLVHLPVGLVHVFFAPFPWTLGGAVQLAILHELAVWYFTVAAAVVGLARVVVLRKSAAAYVVLGGLAISVALALIEGNVGTLLRHRAMLIPFVIIMASFGVTTVNRLRSDLWHRLTAVSSPFHT